MSHASRDPLFEANLVIALQDASDAGDLCLGCHFPRGWLQGRSVPTDGGRGAGWAYRVISASTINAWQAVCPGAVHARAGNRKPPTAASGGDSPVMYFDDTEGQAVFAMNSTTARRSLNSSSGARHRRACTPEPFP